MVQLILALFKTTFIEGTKIDKVSVDIVLKCKSHNTNFLRIDFIHLNITPTVVQLVWMSAQMWLPTAFCLWLNHCFQFLWSSQLPPAIFTLILLLFWSLFSLLFSFVILFLLGCVCRCWQMRTFCTLQMHDNRFIYHILSFSFPYSIWTVHTKYATWLITILLIVQFFFSQYFCFYCTSY